MSLSASAFVVSDVDDLKEGALYCTWTLLFRSYVRMFLGRLGTPQISRGNIGFYYINLAVDR